MIKIRMAITAFMMFMLTQALGQRSFQAKDAVYLEIFGSTGSVAGIGYDRVIGVNTNSYFTFSTALGIFPSTIEGAKPIVGLPILFNYVTGLSKAHFELGAGFCYSQGLQQEAFVDRSGNFGGSNFYSLDAIFFSGRLGLRIQNPDGGFFFRLTANPYIKMYDISEDYPNTKAFLMGGIAFGASF